MLMNHGIELQNIVGDTLHMHRLLTNGRSKQHGLKVLLKNILGIEQPSYASLFSRYSNLGEARYKREGRSRCIDPDSGERVPRAYGGAYSRVGATELIELDRIAEQYPQRLPALYNYATLDALGTLLLYERFVG